MVIFDKVVSVLEPLGMQSDDSFTSHPFGVCFLLRIFINGEHWKILTLRRSQKIIGENMLYEIYSKLCFQVLFKAHTISLAKFG